ncbi:hypothetical protein [Methanobacterium alcaliphilum]|uniref:hypothetical protein n=1 Tax=Methanobacterium alcaliphilum TaxID=392018 RepID=UPI00200A53D4|nr:hypothetical protein [Methanobacterium alcaliphilum]MCK9150650.1 hypothetical protein [Methanobacterium alcaliphilum]
MDTLVAIIMIILFVVLLVFVFSTALLTPIIGKKNLLFVIFMGFMVGVVGGAFFISPLYDDLPEMARSYYQISSNANETIGVDVSTNIDVNNFVKQVESMDGVLEVYSSGIIIRTDPFSDRRKTLIEDRIPIVDANITSYEVYTNGTIVLNTKRGYNPITAINTLSDWLMLTGEINTKYSNVHVSIVAQASQVDNIIKTISKEEVVVTGVQGPVEEKIADLKTFLPSKTSIILFCGLIGLLTGLAGVFIDTIITFISDLRNRIFKKE